MPEGASVAAPLGASPRARRPARPRSTVPVGDEVRRELARELHDRVAQTLTLMVVDMENFKAEQSGRASVLQQVNGLQQSTRDVLNSLREVLYDLRGSLPVDDGFVGNIEKMLNRCRERTEIRTELVVSPAWPTYLRAPAALNLYRIIDEAVTNCCHHSGATSVRVELEVPSQTEIRVAVIDDGRGVDPDRAQRGGLGLIGIKERALLLGGILAIDSVSQIGTTVSVSIPSQNLV